MLGYFVNKELTGIKAGFELGSRSSRARTSMSCLLVPMAR